MPTEPGSMRVMRRLLPYTTAGVVLAVLYVAWVLVARWNENRRLEQAAAAQRAQAEKAIAEVYRGGQLKILNFYVTPGVIHRGQKALVSYGVVNARTVKLDPAVEQVYPSISRCFEVAPERDTRYTLTAEDATRQTTRESFVLQVK